MDVLMNKELREKLTAQVQEAGSIPADAFNYPQIKLMLQDLYNLIVKHPPQVEFSSLPPTDRAHIKAICESLSKKSLLAGPNYAIIQNVLDFQYRVSDWLSIFE